MQQFTYKTKWTYCEDRLFTITVLTCALCIRFRMCEPYVKFSRNFDIPKKFFLKYKNHARLLIFESFSKGTISRKIESATSWFIIYL